MQPWWCWDQAFKSLFRVQTGSVRTKRKIAFAFSVDRNKLGIELDGSQLGSIDVAFHPMTGAWGLGALARSAGIWSRVVQGRL